MAHGAHARHRAPVRAALRSAPAAVVAGAAGAAVVGTHALAEGLPLLPHTAVPAAASPASELHLTAAPHPAQPVAAAVTPVAATAPSAAADAVPELTKAAAAAKHRATVENAIARFEGFIGTSRYENLCERAVENAYGTQGKFASAIDDWRAGDQHPDWRLAPRGALVFYDTSADGHVAVSLGDGRVLSSSAHHQVGIVPIDYFQNPLGWTPEPY